MDKTFLDECFKARMDYLQKRFPIESFRRLFKQQYVRNGYVMIQPIVNKDMDDVMVADSGAGFIFNNEHNLDIALWLVRRWGFSVTKRCEHDGRKEYTAYIVQLPDEYLRRKQGSDKAGIIRTGLRSLSNIDRTKKQKPFDWTV
jgi:hypothetical protein